MCFGNKPPLDPTQAPIKLVNVETVPIKPSRLEMGAPFSTKLKFPSRNTKPEFDMASDPRYKNIAFAPDGSIINLNNPENPSEPKIKYGKEIPYFEKSTVWKHVKPPPEYDHLVTDEL